MKDDYCHQLDDYLLDELPDEQRDRFEQHLRECDTCRSISEQQATIEEQLKSASLSIPLPSGLATQARQRIGHDRRRRVTLSAVCLASAAGLILSIWLLSGNVAPPDDPGEMMTDDRREPATDIVLQPNHPPEEIAAQDPELAVQISFSDNLLAVPVETGDPTITLIQVYPVANTHSETR